MKRKEQLSAAPLAGKVFSNTFFSIVDVLLLKASTVLAFVLLVRLLPNEDIAAIGIATGYLIFIQHLDVGPIRVLLRDYAKIAGDQRRRDELLTALFAFWGVQALAMLLVVVILVAWVFEPMPIEGISHLFVAMAIDFLALTLHGWIKVVYFADFQQRIATRISVMLGTVRFLSYGLLFVWPELTTYSVILVAFAVVGSVVWMVAFQRRFKYRPVWHRGSPRILINSLADYGLWNHFNRIVIDTLFTVDLVVLSWFVGVKDMSSYTIALKFASLLTLVPAQISAALQIASAKCSDPEKQRQVVNSILKINGIVSLAQFAVILVIGNWLMTILFGAEATAGSFLYAMIIAGAVTVFNTVYPLIGLINNFCSLRKAFLLVFLPGLVFGIVAYAISGGLYGALGMAWANVVAYAGLAGGLLLFVSRSYSLSPAWKILTTEEARILKQLFSRGRG